MWAFYKNNVGVFWYINYALIENFSPFEPDRLLASMCSVGTSYSYDENVDIFI